MNELRIGVVGVGRRAIIAGYANQPGMARIVACADPRPTAHQRARELFGPTVHTYTNYQDMTVDNLDAVMIMTPDDRHTEPALFFLNAGIATFVEKPLAITVQDCDQLLAAAHQTRTRLYVGHNLRHLPMLKQMRQLLDDNVIGTVKTIWCRHFIGRGGDYYFKDWHAERSRTTGLLLQKGAHDLDVIHWLADGYSHTVTAMGALAVYGNNPRRSAGSPAPTPSQPWVDPDPWPPTTLTGLNPIVDVEDISMMLSQLDNGVLASYQQCNFTPDYWRSYTIIGDRGRLENFGDGASGDAATIKVWNRSRSDYRTDADLILTIPATPGNGHGGADEHLVAEFLRFAADGGATATSPVAAREAVAAGVAATHSLRNGATPTATRPLAPELITYFSNHQPRTPAERSS